MIRALQVRPAKPSDLALLRYWNRKPHVIAATGGDANWDWETELAHVPHPIRSPILHMPDEYGLEYKNVFFPSMDGVPLEAWFIPADSNKLVIANHPLWFNRYGFPGHLEPWKQIGGAGGNDFEVNFMPDYKHLHDAGYNVLTYDMRNFGFSGAANGGAGSNGIFESRDVVGSLQYAKVRKDTRNMSVGLFSRCCGGNATMIAMTKYPEHSG